MKNITDTDRDLPDDPGGLLTLDPRDERSTAGQDFNMKAIRKWAKEHGNPSVIPQDVVDRLNKLPH